MGKDNKEPEIVKLNLGCGRRILEGYTNVDLPGNHSGIKPDVEADLRKLPFPDEHADEIMAVHVIEHFYVWEVMSVLDEWKRVLKTGGKIILELPNLMSILKFFSEGAEVNIAKTFWGLYGDPRYKDPAMSHRWAYSPAMMADVLNDCGFNGIEQKPAQYHMPARDMRLEAFK